jgi:hypothetical protein
MAGLSQPGLRPLLPKPLLQVGMVTRSNSGRQARCLVPARRWVALPQRCGFGPAGGPRPGTATETTPASGTWRTASRAIPATTRQRSRLIRRRRAQGCTSRGRSVLRICLDTAVRVRLQGGNLFRG